MIFCVQIPIPTRQEVIYFDVRLYEASINLQYETGINS